MHRNNLCDSYKPMHVVKVILKDIIILQVLTLSSIQGTAAVSDIILQTK